MDHPNDLKHSGIASAIELEYFKLVPFEHLLEFDLVYSNILEESLSIDLILD